MKLTVCFSALCLLCSLATSAQLNKGSVLLGGSLQGNTFRFQDQNRTDNKSHRIQFAPSVGLLVRDNLAFGINTALSGGKNKASDGTVYEKYRGGSLGLFVRRYMPLGKSFFLFGEAGAGFSFDNTFRYPPNNAQEQTDKTNSWTLNLYPGLTYAVSKRLLLEAGLNGIAQASYSVRKTRGSNNPGGNTTSRISSFNTNASGAIPLNIGFRFVIGK